MTTLFEKPHTEIQKVFADTNVFITGATGFIGQVLIEKILRTCPVKHVYLLLRPKKGKGPYTRINKMFSNPLYSMLKNEKPDFMKKVSIIQGDCEEPNLGISPVDEDYVVRNMNIIIHCAATINLNGSLKQTTFINVRSTRDLMLIARRIHQLKAFVHVSTAFANTNQEISKEIIYDCHMPGDTLIKMAESFSSSFINSITEVCLGTWPNTYTLSKCVAENVVKQYGEDMPISIVRPSIVVYTKDEPIAGWFTNLNSVPGLCIGIGIGVIRVLLIDSGTSAPIVPADKVANLIITAVWHTTKQSDEDSTIPVFNFVPNNRAPNLTFGQSTYKIIDQLKPNRIYFEKQVWNPSLSITKYKLIYDILFYLYHYIPSLFIDFILWTNGKKFRVVPLYSKLYTMTKDFQYFGTKNFKFDDRNLDMLITHQSAEDKTLFDIDISNINWDKYFLNSALGIRRYVFNEPDGNSATAIKRHRKIMTAYYIFNGTLYAILLYSIYLIFNYVFN